MRASRIFLILFIALCLFVPASFAWRLGQFAGAIERRDAEAVLAMTDTERLRHTIAQQVVATYLQRNPRAQALTDAQRNVVGAVGRSVAEQILAELTTGPRLASLLAGQTVMVDGRSWSLPPFERVRLDDVGAFLGRLEYVNLRTIGLRVDSAAGSFLLGFRFEGAGWRFTDMRLPEPLVEQLVATLPPPR